jgi:hypothetical protein
MRPLHPEFREFLRVLNDQKVDYLVVGGYAVGYHGYPRSTMDLDVWIDRSPENVERLAEAMVVFGFPLTPEQEADMQQEDHRFGIGAQPMHIEVHSTISGVTFGECHARRVVVDIGGTPANIIGFEDLKRNKRASGRHRDLDDLENLP